MLYTYINYSKYSSSALCNKRHSLVITGLRVSI